VRLVDGRHGGAPLQNLANIQRNAAGTSAKASATVDENAQVFDDMLDVRDQDDPLCATEYVVDIYKHYRVKEASSSVRPVYMDNQPHINKYMRAIFVDWLIEVHAKFKLVPETLYLTIIDRVVDC